MSEQSVVEDRFTFGPSEQPGVVLGQSWGQLALIVVDIVLLLQLINPSSTWTTRTVCALLMVLSVLVAYVRVRGETPLTWSTRVVFGRVTRTVGQHEYDGGLLRVRDDEIEIAAARLPGLAGSTRFLELETGPSSPRVVIAHDVREHTFTGVLQLEGQAFYTLEASDQVMRREAYSRLLAALCRPRRPVKRLQILERTVPDTSDALERDFRTRGQEAVQLLAGSDDPPGASTGPVTGPGAAAREVEQGRLRAAASYREIITAAGPAGRRHEVFLALAIDGQKAADAIRKSGGGDVGAAAVVAREVAALSVELKDVGVKVLGWAPPRLLGYVLRTAYDPASTPVIDRRGGGVGDVHGGDEGLPSGVDLRQAGPHKAVNLWGHYRTDSAVHRAYWVTEWPRREAPAAFLTPLLLYADGRRTISLVYEPRESREALRTLRRKLDKAEGESGLRRRFHLRRSKRSELNAAHLDRRENELLAGEALLALRAYITISAASVDELDLLEADIMTAAQRSMIEIQPMYGAHDQGFAVGALPLARSL